MMRGLTVLFLVLMLALIPVATCYGESASAIDTTAALAPTDVWSDWYGHFEARSGFTADLKANEFTPYVTAPVLSYKAWTGELGFTIDIDESTDAKGPDKLLAGATYDLGNLQEWGVDVPWAKYFALSVGPYGTYEFGTGKIEAGLLVSLMQLSFDDGNVKRHRTGR
jgi:hypothetical protein